MSFLEMTGFTFSSFRLLVRDLFFDEINDELNRFNNNASRKRGRPRSLDYIARTGLVLFFLNSTMGLKHLSLLLGVVPAVASVEINEMLVIVVTKLHDNQYARVRFPTLDECQHYAELVRSREPTVTDCTGFLDGLRISCRCSDDPVAQAVDYSGYAYDAVHLDDVIQNNLKID